MIEQPGGNGSSSNDVSHSYPSRPHVLQRQGTQWHYSTAFLASKTGKNSREVLALPHHGDKAELLEHAKSVIETPVFRDLAACDASDFDGRDRHLLTGWGNAPQRSLMRSMGRKSDDDLVSFLDHVLNRDVQIRET